MLQWLGMAGFLINSRGTTVMIDPLLGGFDMPIMIEMPIAAAEVPHVDAILITHSDNDHFSRPTCRELAPMTGAFHSTSYVASLMAEEGLGGVGHPIGDVFDVGPVRVEVTPADHAWQNEIPGEDEHFPARGRLRVLVADAGRDDLGARGLPVDPGASPEDAGAGCDAVRLLRQ